MRRIVLIALVLSALASAGISAQGQSPVQPGARVRVTATQLPHGRQTGTLSRIDADTLTLDATQIPVQSVSRLEVSTGRRSHTLLGAGIGVLAGASAGALLMASQGSDPCGEMGTRGECILGAAAILGGAGLIVGGIVGALVKTDRWEDVPPERLGGRLGASLYPNAAGGLSVGLSLRF